MHWDDVHFATHQTLVRGFKRLGIFKSTFADNELLDSGVTVPFYPHGLGHSLGLDVHDVPSASKPADNPTLKGRKPQGHSSIYQYLRLRLPLEEGMVVVSAALYIFVVIRGLIVLA